MSGEVQDTIRTKELRLVDNNGQDRAVFATENNGAVFLNFLDGKTQPRARLGINTDGKAVLELGHGEGIPNVSIGVEPDGRVRIEGYDSEGVERFKLEITANGSHTELSFHEKYRHPRMILMAEDKGPAGLFILDQHGKALFSTTP